MKIYTIGFTQKSAEKFFNLIRQNNVEIVVDIRLNNKSQLAGFAKGTDLSYFLQEICKTDYIHCEEYAPTKELLSDYQKRNITWIEYEKEFTEILKKRRGSNSFLKRFGHYENICLLCSEATPEHCHRRLVAEMIQAECPTVEIVHL